MLSRIDVQNYWMNSILESEVCSEYNQELRRQEPQFPKNLLAQEWQS